MTRRFTLFVFGIACLVLTLSADPAVGQKKKKKKRPEPPAGVIDPVGQPAGLEKKAGKVALYAVWYEDGFWHLRVTSPKGKFDPEKTKLTGRVRVNGDRVGLQVQGLDLAKKPGRADWIFPHSDLRGFDFQFATFGKIDGVNFNADKKSTEIEFTLMIDGGEQPKHVFIGEKGYNPEKIPFSLPAHPDE